MSETKHYKGKIYVVHPPNGETLQEYSKRVLDESNVKVNEYQFNYHKGDYVRILCDEKHNEYLRIDEQLFLLKKREIDLDDDILEFERDETSVDTFDFECKFYNGGTCLSEMLEEGYKRLFKKG